MEITYSVGFATPSERPLQNALDVNVGVILDGAHTVDGEITLIHNGNTWVTYGDNPSDYDYLSADLLAYLENSLDNKTLSELLQLLTHKAVQACLRREVESIAYLKELGF